MNTVEVNMECWKTCFHFSVEALINPIYEYKWPIITLLIGVISPHFSLVGAHWLVVMKAPKLGYFLLILYFFDLRGFKDKKFSEKMTGLWQMLKINQYIDIDDIDILDIWRIVQDSKKKANSKAKFVLILCDPSPFEGVIHSFWSGEHLVVRDFPLGRKRNVWAFWVLSPKKSSCEPLERLEKNQAFPEKKSVILQNTPYLGYIILWNSTGMAPIN